MSTISCLTEASRPRTNSRQSFGLGHRSLILGVALLLGGAQQPDVQDREQVTAALIEQRIGAIESANELDETTRSSVADTLVGPGECPSATTGAAVNDRHFVVFF